MSWLNILSKIENKESPVSDEELKDLLSKKPYPAYRSVNDKLKILMVVDDINTFEAFRNANQRQVEILLERFPKQQHPELIDNLGHYYAFYGKLELCDYLISKGMNLDIAAIGLIKGLRELEDRGLEIYNDKYGIFSAAQAEEMNQLKLDYLGKLIDQGLDTNFIANHLTGFVYQNLHSFHLNHKRWYCLQQEQQFFASGKFKEINKALKIIAPEKSLRNMLFGEIAEHLEDCTLVEALRTYLGLRIIGPYTHDPLEQEKIIHRIVDQMFISADVLELIPAASEIPYDHQMNSTSGSSASMIEENPLGIPDDLVAAGSEMPI